MNFLNYYIKNMDIIIIIYYSRIKEFKILKYLLLYVKIKYIFKLNYIIYIYNYIIS